AERGSVMQAIRVRIAEEHGLAVHGICLIQEGSLPRTTSGKVQRHLAQDQYARGILKLLGQWSVEGFAPGAGSAPLARAEGGVELAEAGAPGIGAWLRARLAGIAQLPLDQVDLDLPLATYGLDSRAALGLAVELEQRLGVRVSPIVFYDHPSARLVSHHLADLVAGGARSVGPAAGSTLQAGVKDSAALGDGVAIVGMACRFPGAEDIEAFWRLLRDGGIAVSSVPSDRWAERPAGGGIGFMGTGGSSAGGFLSGIDQFDPVFFGISPREAAFMDPQQRLVLEAAWTALESAGIAPDSLAGSATGVFVGVCTNDYSRLRSDAPEMRALYAATGNSHAVAANRVSYLLDLHGPSMAVDTACSSSLLAVHLACASLRQGESTLALAGGVNVLLDPENSAAMAQGGSLSPTGACRTFDAEADGYVRSEGCGMLVLKPLAAARRDGNPIWAVIAGSATNQDGRSNGLTAPNGLAQEAVVRQALRNAQVLPSQIGYVETHGTGTPLGDPIEVAALRRTLGADQHARQPVWLGSVKANIGHLEAAAGIAGMIKAALVLSKEEIPPQVNFERANPALDLERSGLAVPTTRVPWRAGQGLR
ncbi:MAG TPA: beta-ketoacyl synthase N-terminal-like domain-containing protein, partial [Chloroflexota bacterium]|nr:beta-ketoacyl synthase N-terminal-like domain-containing protein [Chloroflexota bacterium]